MLYSVGYQLKNDGSFVEAVCIRKEHIGEIYFSWEDFPNGRGNELSKTTLAPSEARIKKESELKIFKDLGIRLNLLMNGNCYGRYAQSRSFFYKLGSTVDYISEKFGLGSVTTTSPLIAKFLKQNYPDIEVRASVNMEIGTTDGMDYLAELFDSYYLAREYNRDINRIKEIRDWCNQNGKRLYGIANSGCLKSCSSHTFHDNLVSHEREISEMDNAYQFEGQCYTYLKSAVKREAWLRITTFIRPEDVQLYEGLFDGLKLATRVSRNPRKIIDAYARGLYRGCLAELLEPDHSALFYPTVIENSRLPAGFGEKVLNCDKKCSGCGYCKTALTDASVCLE